MRARWPGGAAALLLGLSACSGATPAPVASPSPSRTPAPSATLPAPPPPPGPPPALALPTSCPRLVATFTLEEALGTQLYGPPGYLRVGPLPASGRRWRVTCTYGARAGKPPPVEVTLIAYGDARTAAGRVERSVAAARDQGDRVARVRVIDLPGYVLEDRAGSSLTVAQGAQTVVVTLRAGAVPAKAVRPALVKIASRVLVGVPD